jgi:hypothetical protein
MNEPASDVIAARAHAGGTLTSPLVWSVAAHVAIVAAIWPAPYRRAVDTPRLVMTITSGAPGPRTGGLTGRGLRGYRNRRPGAEARRAHHRHLRPRTTVTTLPTGKPVLWRPTRAEPAPPAGRLQHRSRRAT